MPKTMTAILTCAALGLPLAAAAGGLKLPPAAAYLVGGDQPRTERDAAGGL